MQSWHPLFCVAIVWNEEKQWFELCKGRMVGIPLNGLFACERCGAVVYCAEPKNEKK